MNKLRIILQHNVIYYIILFLALLYFLVASNIEYESVYKQFFEEEFIITNIKISDDKVTLNLKASEKIIAYYYEEDVNNFVNNFFLGDKVRISGDINDIKGSTVFNTFDYKKYLYNQKIYNVITITNIEKIEESKNVFYKLKNVLFRRSEKLKLSSSYVNSLIFGNNNFIEDDIKSSYQENGISHLFAVSGLHISIFVLLISSLLKKFKVNEVIIYIISILFLLFYMFLTNYSMSILRGAILTILIILNKIFKLNVKTVNLLLFTISIIIFINPLYLYNIGLQFSFLITFYLIVFSTVINNLRGKIKQLFMTSLLSFVVSYPIVVNNFYQVNFLSVFYNIFFVPYVSYIVMPFVIISYIFPFFDKVLYFLIMILEKLSMFLNDIDFSKVILCKMDVFHIVLYYVIMTVVFYMMKKGKFKYFVFIVLFMIIHYFCPLKKDDYFMVLDVGQGDSAVLYIDGVCTLIDTGGYISYDDSPYSYSISKNKILPYLKSMGVRKIDNLILTHGDADHMKEASYIVENFKVDKVIFNSGEYNYLELDLVRLLDNKDILYINGIEKLNIGNNRLYFLNNELYDNENDNSSVIYTELNGIKLLLMGDVGVEVEEDIIEKYNLSNIDILKVGHHGSKTSSSREFIDSIKPKYSIISVGENNRYGHPNNEVLENLEDSNIYRTDIDGSVVFKINNDKLEIKTCIP